MTQTYVTLRIKINGGPRFRNGPIVPLAMGRLFSYLETVEVRFAPDVEKKLNDLAAQSGRRTDELLQDALARYLDESALTRKEVGLLEVNKQYQEAIKVVITLVTASLVLPIVFVKNILGVADQDIRGSLCPWAYRSWILLIISLLACLLFYLSSTKFTKAVYYNTKETRFWGVKTEKWRDTMALIATLSLIFGLGFLLYFFLNALSMKPAAIHSCDGCEFWRL